MIEQWFHGENPELSATILLDRFDPCFRLITFETKTLTFNELSSDWAPSIRGAYPNHQEKIESFQKIYETNDTIVVNYIETQTRGEQITKRLATALMKRNQNDSQKVDWIIQHEG
ncbi:MAG: hypothetical protein E6Q32_06455 [Neisseriales bacterium]|nr:MAG: hypothetical protein E6Q32_06455 [Neisseriales bacterium]